MKYTLANAMIYQEGIITNANIVIEDGKIIKVNRDRPSGQVIDCSGQLIAPSFIDPHVHSRTPGYDYKENIKTVTKAAARGGYTKVFFMPNLKPVPSNKENFLKILELINRDALIECIQLGSITQEQMGFGPLSNINELTEYTIGFSDDGNGIVNSTTMKEAMTLALKYQKSIIAHAEDKILVNSGVIHDGEFSKINNLPGISSESEYAQVKRDLELAGEIGVHYHLCHVSTVQSVDMIREYKKTKTNVSVEVTPHHLLLDDSMLIDHGNYKVNPPIRANADREALIEGIKDGTIDMIATDHAPHSAEEKEGGLLNSAFGFSSIEISFAILYTYLVRKGIIELEKLLDLMSKNVADVFKIESNNIGVGRNANLVIIDLNARFIIEGKDFLSKGKNTPFIGHECYGKVKKTILKGEIIYEAF